MVNGTGDIICDNLTVNDDCDIRGNLTSRMISNLETLNVVGNETVGGTLTVTGDTTLDTAVITTLTTDGDCDIKGNLTSRMVSSLETLDVVGNETVGGTLTVTGDTTLDTAVIETLTVNSNCQVFGTLTGRADCNLETLAVSTTATVTGNTTLSTLSCTGDVTMDLDCQVNGNLTVNGTITSSVTTDDAFEVQSVSITGNSKTASGTINLINNSGNRPFAVFPSFYYGLNSVSGGTYDLAGSETACGPIFITNQTAQTFDY
jgi:cytoskeletal protein CcmA (bactofilin family)